MSSELHKTVLKRSRRRIEEVLGARSPRGDVMITAANGLTLLRLAIVPFFWVAFFADTMSVQIVATALFIIAAVSDLWDGKLARRYCHETPFGGFMDPLADKALVLSAFWAILIREEFDICYIPTVISVVLITLREIGLTVMRIRAISGGSTVVTSIWGKIKTTIQLTALILLLLLFNLRDVLDTHSIEPRLLRGNSLALTVAVLFALCAFSSVATGLLYLRHGRLGAARSCADRSGQADD